MKARLYLLWLRFLRYGMNIDLDAAKKAGNANEKAWCVNRISQLDQQIDNVRICAQ